MDSLKKILTAGKLNVYEFKNEKEVRGFLKQQPEKFLNRAKKKESRGDINQLIEINPEWKIIQ